MSNPIRETSELYDKLCQVYDEEKLRERFKKCYTLIDDASYDEIHYVISMLKESSNEDDFSGISIGGIIDLSGIMNLLKLFAASKTIRRCAFLLDLLEEARERKRMA